MRRVDALRSTVKSINDAINETMMIYGRFLSVPASHPPRITGRSGSTHGASTVRIPARNDMRMMVSIGGSIK